MQFFHAELVAGPASSCNVMRAASSPSCKHMRAAWPVGALIWKRQAAMEELRPTAFPPSTAAKAALCWPAWRNTPPGSTVAASPHAGSPSSDTSCALAHWTPAPPAAPTQRPCGGDRAGAVKERARHSCGQAARPRRHKIKVSGPSLTHKPCFDHQLGPPMQLDKCRQQGAGMPSPPVVWVDAKLN